MSQRNAPPDSSSDEADSGSEGEFDPHANAPAVDTPVGGARDDSRAAGDVSPRAGAGSTRSGSGADVSSAAGAPQPAGGVVVDEEALAASLLLSTGFRFPSLGRKPDADATSAGGGDGQRGEGAGGGAAASEVSMSTTEYKFESFVARTGGGVEAESMSAFRPLLRRGMRDRIVNGEALDEEDGEGGGGEREDSTDYDSATTGEREQYDYFDRGEDADVTVAVGGVTMSMPATSGARRASQKSARSVTSGTVPTSPVSQASDGGSQSRRVSFTSAAASTSSQRRGSRRSSRRSSGRRSSAGPAQPVAMFWGKRNDFASTQPPVLPASQHHLVLRTLISALRTQLVPDDSIPTIFQPPVGRIDDQFYPDSVRQEHEEYFWKCVPR